MTILLIIVIQKFLGLNLAAEFALKWLQIVTTCARTELVAIPQVSSNHLQNNQNNMEQLLTATNSHGFQLFQG